MVKHRRGLVLLLAAACRAVQSVPSGPLPSSESLQYKIEWRLITAGKAQLYWKAGDGGFNANLLLETTGLVSKLFKVNDEYAFALDRTLCAHSTFLKTHERPPQPDTPVTFTPAPKNATYKQLA